MANLRGIATSLVLGVLASWSFAPLCSADSGNATTSVKAPGLTEVLYHLPVLFEENVGQFDSRAHFVSRGAAHDTYLTDSGATFVLKSQGRQHAAVVRMRLVGAAEVAQPVALDPQAGRTNYFIDNDPARFATDVKTFARVKYASVYRGIDLLYYGMDGQLECDFVLAPRANPRDIKLAFEGTTSLRLTTDGDLVLQTATGELTLRKPLAYQDIGGNRRVVDAGYIVADNRSVSFHIGKYDRHHTLVVDPILGPATMLWGWGDPSVALDAAKNIYVVGTITTTDLPATNGYQTQLAGYQDAFVVKLNPAGTSVVYATYLGARRSHTTGGATTSDGSGGVYGTGGGIVVDGAGNAYFTGSTDATSFPITPGAYRSAGSQFVVKLNPAGNGLVYSTFVDETVSGLAVDAAGSIYMTGWPSFVAKLNPAGSAMTYTTILKGSGSDSAKGIALDATGNAYVVGIARSADFPTVNPYHATLNGPSDAFVAKLSPAGSVIYSTYLGGSAKELGLGIAVDGQGQAIVAGWTSSTDFPVTAGAFQPALGQVNGFNTNVFVSKLNAAGNGLVYSSYLGGRWCLTDTVYSCLGFFGPEDGIDAGTSVAVDAAGYAYIAGYAKSAQFPQVDSIQSVSSGGDVAASPFMAKVTPAGNQLVYAAVLGDRTADGMANQVVADGTGGALMVGSAPVPLTSGAVLGSGALFLAKFNSGIYPSTVRSSSNPVGRGQPITFSATVLNPSGGVVTFKDGATPLGSSSAANGEAAITVTLQPGVHAITATNDADGKVSPTYFQLVRGQ